MTRPKHTLQMRPTYEWEVATPPEEFVARLGQLVSFDPAVTIEATSKYALLGIPEEARQFWSPTLDINVEARGDGAYIFARLGPAPHVWFMFMVLYALCVAPGVFAAMFGCAQLMMGQRPVAFVGVPAALLGMLGIYVASFVGRGLGAEQVHRLLATLEANLDPDAKPLH